MLRNLPTGFKIGFAVIASIIVILIGLNLYAALITSQVTVTVENKESVSKRGADGTTDHQYRVYAVNGDVYSVSDSLLRLHFSSSNTYAKLKEDKTYQCTAQGFRVPLFSQFKNLVDCEPLNAP